MNYFRLDTHGELSPEFDRFWQWKQKGKLICPNCKRISAAWDGQPVDEVLEHTGHASVGLGAVSQVVCADLWRALGADPEHHVIGRCINTRTGEPFENYLSVYAKKPYRCVTYTGPNATYRRCTLCGALGWAFYGKAPYLLASELRGERVVQDQNGFIYVSPAVASEFDASPFPDLSFEAVRVLQEHPPGQPVFVPDEPAVWFKPRKRRDGA